jgi:hypothetical protein
MKNLLLKEFRLATHPTNIIFLFLSAMLLIPDYPYYVAFFYTTLGIFFLCLTGRENHDIEFTLALPVEKARVVDARITYCVLIELAQLLLAVPFAVLRQKMLPAGNEVGMDANIAFFGLSFVMLGLFNLMFFPAYYKKPAGVGKAFIISSIVLFLFITVAEGLTHILPFFRDQLDTPDPQYLAAKLAVLAAGIAVFTLANLLAVRISERRFTALDL